YGRFFYPGTGAAQEIGHGLGQGSTINVPLPPYVGDAGYLKALRELIWPRVEQFAPELILVSAGFDAHWQDPLAYAGLSLTGYAQIARLLVEMAESLTDGRILFVLEGGYYHEALAHGVINTFYALLGRDEIVDPLGASPENETDIVQLLSRLRRLHLI
ncbi:MAG: hypothetical protein KDE28_18490, partial [Anaerolineales bacterium]|nr:hypothetical protein [Anaerolineales bacterium]